MLFFVAFVALSIAALLLGLKLQGRHVKSLFVGALLITVLCFVLYVVGANYGREIGDRALRDSAQFVVLGAWVGIYAASGLSGPALATRGAPAIAISTVATLATLTLGTWLIFALACGLAGECI